MIAVKCEKSILNDPATVVKKEKRDRPIIYTFFEGRDGIHSGRYYREQQELLKIWMEVWSDAGWEPKVLTLEDAKKHPDYEKYSNKILHDQPNGNLRANSFDFMCFMRWLAMAAHGKGGWMSDYDTLPMGIKASHDLPHSGKFTCYDGHVPSLMSGLPEEWSRVGNLLLDIAVSQVNNENLSLVSDMLAMRTLFEKSSSSYVLLNKVFKGYPYKIKNEVNCKHLTKNFAVHLSHARTKESLEKGIFEIPDTIKIEYVSVYVDRLRPRLAAKLYEDWKKQCHNLRK